MRYNLPQALIDMSRPTKKRPQYAKLKEEKCEIYKEYNKSKRVYTELAVAKKNIDYILDKDNEQYEESHKKDDYEQSK